MKITVFPELLSNLKPKREHERRSAGNKVILGNII